MTDSAQSLCKGCRPEYKVTEAQIARILDSPMFDSEHCVSDEVYRIRLELCRTCVKCQDGLTCMLCGCIVPVAAKLKARGCPLPGGGRWAAE
ncbi:hypothetical protein ACFO1S_03230 [Cohnella boryungensis]|uniref:Uncharacterized protein n=1 Tax=Cohnella boryungensis TaxID=768479 RepID=A0ABV8S540_9BACL